MTGDSDTVAATASDLQSSPAQSHALAIERGELLGRYVILGELGAGGMGVVFAAYDPDLDRKVAIKLLIPTGRDPADARARLLREAQAMAKLSHPHVVNVHDVGTVGERVYVAMEFVEGQTLTRWLATGQRSWREIVGVFVQVARGLAAAHAEGLLHRDVKPDNVMIDHLDRARVMDFGLVRSVEDSSPRTEVDVAEDEIIADKRKGSAQDAITRVGALMGTPAYMAPEQFENLTVDARTDQFGFCVALWEGLYGERPFAGEGLMDLVVAVADGRRREPPRGRGVPGWLRRVVERGLSPRPEDRWPTMDALSIELARDPARARSRWIVGGAVVVALGAGTFAWWRTEAQLCAGATEALAGVWDDGRRASVESTILASGVSYAADVWEKTGPQIDAWAGTWMAMHTDTCEATRRRGEQSESVMDLRMACLSRARLDLVAATDVLESATPSVIQNAHDIVGGLPTLDRCADVEALQAQVVPPASDEIEAVDDVRAELADAKAQRLAAAYEAAFAAVSRADASAQVLHYEPLLTEVALELGHVHEALGQFAEAEAAFRTAQREGAHRQQWSEVSEATGRLMWVLGYRQSRATEALALRDLAEGLSRRVPRDEAKMRAQLAAVLSAQGNYEAAEAEQRRALALHDVPADTETASFRTNLGDILNARGKPAEAEVEHRAALAALEEAVGPRHPITATARNNLAAVLWAQGKHEEALSEHRATLAVLEAALGPDHPNVAGSRNNLGAALRELGRHAEAEAELRAALRIVEHALGPDHPHTATARDNLGLILRRQEKYAEAEAEHRASLEIRARALGPDHPDVAYSRNNLATVLTAVGRRTEAEAELRAALAILEPALGPDHPDVAKTLQGLGNALVEDDRRVEAIPLLERALEIHRRAASAPARRAATAFALARALSTKPSARARARELAREALELNLAAKDVDRDAVARIEQWLEDHR